tara:strand:+ start:22339 stop:23475 length:1137 start_codon:yes stop_codon:yes gene_type:complete
MSFKLGNTLSGNLKPVLPDYSWQTFRSGFTTHLEDGSLTNANTYERTPTRLKLKNSQQDIINGASGPLNENYSVTFPEPSTEPGWLNVGIWIRLHGNLSDYNSGTEGVLFNIGGNPYSPYSNGYFSASLEQNGVNPPKLALHMKGVDGDIATMSMNMDWFSSPGADARWFYILCGYKMGVARSGYPDPNEGAMRVKVVTLNVYGDAAISEWTATCDPDIPMEYSGVYAGHENLHDNTSTWQVPVTIGCGDWALDDPAYSSASALTDMQIFPELEWNNFTVWFGAGADWSDTSLFDIWSRGPMRRTVHREDKQLTNISAKTPIRGDKGPYDILGNLVKSEINGDADGYEDRWTYPTEAFGLGGPNEWSFSNKFGTYTGS